MSDRREEIFNTYSDVMFDACGDSKSTLDLDGAKNAMDEYMKECCIALLEYVAFNTTDTLVDVSGVKFKYKGEWISKEQLFENFL